MTQRDFVVNQLDVITNYEAQMKMLLLRFVYETEGQDLIEYALLAATIALGAIAGMQAVRNAINTEFTSIGESITSAS